MQDSEGSDLPEAIKRSGRSMLVSEMCMALAHEQSGQLFKLSALLSNLFAKVDRPDLQEIKGQISALVDDMQTMLNRLRLFTRPREYNRGPVEAVIRAAVDLLSHRIRSKALALRVNIAAEARHLIVRSELLDQVLVNLLVNAVEHVPIRSGSIFIEAKPVGSQLQITIADNGTGIPDNLKELIWEPFFTTSPNRAGLGLAIVQNLLTEIGGSISLDSGYIKGSRFVVLLPVER